MKKNNSQERKPTFSETFATKLPLFLDTSGLFFVEARSRVRRAKKGLAKLLPELQDHVRRIESANEQSDSECIDDAWTAIIREVGRMETVFGSTINDFLVADVLLVASAESYINVIADHELPSAEFQQFDKLSPVGKWLVLPRMMNLKWNPSLDKGNLQEFAGLAARRNRVVHPKPIFTKNIAEVAQFIERLKIDARAAEAGIGAVKGLIREISLAWRGSNGPDWLESKKAKNRPPCFVLGGPEITARLGRARRVLSKT